jgi:mannosyl-oligosaccharide glucosidase
VQTYAREDGPYKVRAQKIYEELRKNVVDNVFKVWRPAFHSPPVNDLAACWLQEYQRTGYVWEQYDATTGQGKRRRVVVLIRHTGGLN